MVSLDRKIIWITPERGASERRILATWEGYTIFSAVLQSRESLRGNSISILPWRMPLVNMEIIAGGGYCPGSISHQPPFCMRTAPKCLPLMVFELHFFVTSD